MELEHLEHKYYMLQRLVINVVNEIVCRYVRTYPQLHSDLNVSLIDTHDKYTRMISYFSLIASIKQIP